MPEWDRILPGARVLLGGLGCFMLAWAGLALDARVGGLPLWLADALLVFLALGRSGAALAAILAAGAIGILAGHWTHGAAAAFAIAHTGAAVAEAVIARWALGRFAPQASRLENAGSLVRLLLWAVVLPPVAGAVLAGLGAIAAGTVELAVSAFANWWCGVALGNCVLLPPLLALDNRKLADPKLLHGRRGEAIAVLLLVVALTALALHPDSVSLPLFLGLPLVMWAGLRFDFRTTALICLTVVLISVVAAALGLWPLYWSAANAGAVRTLQIYQLALVLPALFASLLTQEQRVTDAARLAAMQALRAVMDAVPAAIVTLTPSGKVGLWSRGAERIFGWRRDEVEGDDPPYLAPQNAAQAASLRQRVLAGNEIRNQSAERRNRAGEQRELVINALPQRDADGNITGIIAVMDDITDRRRLEESREEHRAQLAAIIDAVADPIITIDEDGIITSFSRAAEAVFGYAASEVMGRNVKLLMPEPERGRHDAYLRRYRETGARHIIGTSRRVAAQRKDGTTFAAEIVISEAWLDGRRIYAGIVRDLGAKTAPKSEAPLADAQNARFLARITHDLRQPLHALSLMTAALERRVKDPDTGELVDDLSRIVRSIQGIFENVVEWTRIEGGQVGSVPGVVVAGDLFAALAQEFAPEAARRNIAFRWVGSRTSIACDPVLARRILKQLLDNAVTFTPHGKVLLGARRHGLMLRLIVADTGVGIPADQLDFVFEPYSQLDAGREAGGLGLGLAIARRLAALAGLTVGVRSMPGKGSQFWIDVPRA